MKKILIVTYSMTPYSNSFGSFQRMYFLAEYLLKKNLEIVVISYKDKMVNRINSGYKVNFNHIAINTNKFMSFLERIYNYVIKINIIKFNFSFIEELNLLNGIGGITWLISAKKIIKKTIIKNNIDTVIISGPPFTLFSGVRFIKKYKCQIILDYRDPWFNWSKNSYLRKKEKKFLSQVDKVMVFSELFMNDLIIEYNLEKSKCFAVYNGFINDSWNNYIQESPDRIDYEFDAKYLNITLTGSYSLTSHEPTSIVKFLETLSNYQYKNNFKIRIVGLKRENSIYWENKLMGIVIFTGTVKHKDAINLILKSDVLLMSYPCEDIFRTRYMIMGKFMDYLKSKKPIWGISNHPSEFSSMISQYGLGINCNNSEEEIKKYLDILLELKEKNSLPTLRNKNFDLEYFYERDFQYNRFVENCSN